jgi:hypothetical protein
VGVLAATTAACFPDYQLATSGTDSGPRPDGAGEIDGGPTVEAGAEGGDGGASSTAVTYVGSGQNFVNEASNGHKTVTVTLDGQPMAGDVLLAVVWCNDPGSTMTGPSGWSARGTQASPTGSNMWWYSRVAVAGEPASVSLACDGTDEIYAGVAFYRGAQGENPVDAEYGPALCGSSGECDAQSIVTTHAGDRLVMLYALDGSDGTYSWTQPQGATKRVDLGEVAIADAPVTTVGATGTQVAMHTNDSEYAGVDFVALAAQ